MQKIFITGTDTNVGKTYVTVGLLKLLAKFNLKTIGLKPLASGCVQKQGQLYSDDALKIQAAATIMLEYSAVNPMRFLSPIAPHIAAQQSGHSITVAGLQQLCAPGLQHPTADICVIEGVGGWYVPLNQSETMSDFVKAENCAVILVVGIKLGCLNHAILTYRALLQDQVKILGWVANCVDQDTMAVTENIAVLQEWLAVPLLGVVGHDVAPSEVLAGALSVIGGAIKRLQTVG
jgi:dethiobiotin synthetase